ncbi:hypothetical protein L1987_43794 [Smallanthus sonchifolius]|uniref:Uncharacterized protein n=1 Tax=Smallanthus sonchifolius TaxID=185202 RepID=A0ACB9GNV8_9ASTR|nr:hypothetical protein L1987_43794 [Smallanthus sonchifolius]
MISDLVLSSLRFLFLTGIFRDRCFWCSEFRLRRIGLVSSIGTESDNLFHEIEDCEIEVKEKDSSISKPVVFGGNGGGVVAGILYKWVHYGKGWRSRWFTLEDGVLSYYKTHGPDKIVLNPGREKGIKVIGDESVRYMNNRFGSKQWKPGDSFEAAMEDKHGYDSSYPKDLPWQELKAKAHVDETIFENKGINAKEEIGSGSLLSNHHHEDAQSEHMKNKRPGKEPRPLPHQQVPQPHDFSTQALEQL